MKLTNLFFLLLTTTFFLGCSQKQIEKNPYIKDTQTLKQSPFDEKVQYYKTKEFQIKNYNKFIIEDIKVIKNKNTQKVDKPLLKNISSYFQTNLEKKLNSEIQTNKKNGELILKVAITNIDVAYEDLKFYQYLPYGLAFTAIKRGVGFEKKDLNIQLVLKLIDKKSMKTQLLLVDNGLVENIQSHDKLNFENIKPLLDVWINKYELRVKEFNQGKYNKK